MVLDAVFEEHRPLAQCWLYRWHERSPFAYARGDEFIRYADHARWAQLQEDRLISMRSGECLAFQVGNVFYDSATSEPLYYEKS
jgi:hypothetical protein